MFTKAARQALQTVATWTTVNDAKNAIPVFPTQSIRNTANEERWVCTLVGNLISTVGMADYDTWSGFSFGTGTTAPTINDYKIENFISGSDMSKVLTDTARGVDTNGKPYMEFTFVLSNRTSSTITVTEVAYVTNSIAVCDSASATSAFQNDILIDRTLLDTPVAIAAGDSASIKYRITCDMSFS